MSEDFKLNATINMIELEAKLTRVLDGIEVLKDSQELMTSDISKIKEAVYNPDEGIYARLKVLENWKNTQSKIIWMLATSFVGLLTAFLFNSVIN